MFDSVHRKRGVARNLRFSQRRSAVDPSKFRVDLQPAKLHQHELALDREAPDTVRPTSALDRINDRYGYGTLAMASAGTARTQKHWGMERERRTPRYTTCWRRCRS